MSDADGKGPEGKGPLDSGPGGGPRLSRMSLNSLKRRLSLVKAERREFRAEHEARVEEIKEKKIYGNGAFLLAFTAVGVGVVVFLIWLFPPQIQGLEVLDFGMPDPPVVEEDAGPPDAGPEVVDAGSDAGPRRGGWRGMMTGMTEMGMGALDLGNDDDPIGGLDLDDL